MSSDEGGRGTELVDVVVDGRFRVLRLLGSGGMGAVYLAEQLNLSRQVALKVLRPGIFDDAFRARFKAEAMATSRLNHPNIVTVHDFGIDASRPVPLPYLVLEKLEGQSLRDRLNTRGRLGVADGLAVLTGIASALVEAHAAGIIHRDLKPENVFLVQRASDASSFSVKVLDFGIAKILDADGSRTQTASGVVAGTPGYLAPERLHGSNDDPRSDLYAVGVIAWEIFAGQPPFSAATPMALTIKHLMEPPPRFGSLPDLALPPALDDFVTSLLDKSPDLRPRDARAVLQALRALASSTSSEGTGPRAESTSSGGGAPMATASTPAPSSTPAPTPAALAPIAPAVPVAPPPRSFRRAALALIAVAALGAIGASVLWRQRHRESLRDEGTRLVDESNFGAANTAWRRACLDDGDAMSCRFLATLVTAHPKFAVQEQEALTLWARGCDGGDNRSCLQLGRAREYGTYGDNTVDSMQALRAYARACRAGENAADAGVDLHGAAAAGAKAAGASDAAASAIAETVDAEFAQSRTTFNAPDETDALGCFHHAVALAAGIGAGRVEFGTIDVLPAERAAASAECDATDDRHSVAACFALSLVAMHESRTSGNFDKIRANRSLWRTYCHDGFGAACRRLEPYPEAEKAIVAGAAAGNPKAARDDYETALTIDPDNVDAMCALASLDAREHRDAEALEPLRRAIALEPSLTKKLVGDQGFAELEKSEAFQKLLRDVLSAP